jgi:RecD/TraA family predicted helicase
MIQIKGVLDRFPIAGDTLEIESLEPTKDRDVFQAQMMKVDLPSNPDVLPKYLKLIGVANVIGFGEKRMNVLCSGPINVWELLEKEDPNEWGDAYNGISLDIRRQLHNNFAEFKKKNPKVDTDIPLLMTRLGIKMSKETMVVLCKFCKFKKEGYSLECYIRDNLLELLDIVATKYVRSMAESLGASEDVVECIDVLCALKENEIKNGHTYIHRQRLKCKDNTLSTLVEMDKIFVYKSRVFLRRTYENEGFIAEYLSKLNEEPSCLDDVLIDQDDIASLSEEQTQAVMNAFEHRISILTGGPGTGKTTTIRSIIRALEYNALLDQSVVLLAPTGKAVARIQDVLKGNEAGITAQTIHRFIHMVKQEREVYIEFDKNQLSINDIRMLILDEMSMVDVATFSELLRTIATFPDLHIVLAGDVVLLPSIGCGNVFADILASGAFPMVRLTQVMRQKEGDLMDAIVKIREGIVPQFRKESCDFVYGGEDPVPTLKRIAAEFKDNPEDLLIITPMNKSVKEYECVVRKVMNPSVDVDDGIDEGDRVIQKKNVYPELQEPRFNGMMGSVREIHIENKRTETEECGERRVIQVDLSYVTVAFDNDGGIERDIPLNSAKEELEFAYLLTIHKSQGSEAKTVVVVLDERCYNMNFITRNLLYTAVSRAKERCIVVGSRDIIAHAVKNKMPNRNTCLKCWLQ